MKKQLLTVALLLATNTALQAINGPVSRPNPYGPSQTNLQTIDAQQARIYENPNPAIGTIRTHYFPPHGRSGMGIIQYRYEGNGKWVEIKNTMNLNPIGGSPYALPPADRNMELERMQHEDLVNTVHKILKIVTELRDRK